MPLLRQVAALLRERGADPVRVNLEIKYDALDASDLTTREAFVDKVVDALRVDGLVPARASSASTGEYWTASARPSLRWTRNLLVSPKYLRHADGAPSPLVRRPRGRRRLRRHRRRGGLHGDLADPRLALPLRRGRSGLPALRDAALVDAAHAAGLAVMPYVVDDAPTMRHLVRLGVDGLITNHPERLRDVLAARAAAFRPRFPAAPATSHLRSVSST